MDWWCKEKSSKNLSSRDKPSINASNRTRVAKESSSLLSLIYPQEKGEQRRDQFSGGGSGDISFP
jgi:hypothetical protein